MGEQLVTGLLHNQEHLAGPFATRSRSSLERHLPRTFAMQPGQAARKRRLSCAVASHQSRDAPGRERTGGPAQHIVTATVARTQVAERECRSGDGAYRARERRVLPVRRRAFGAGILDAPSPKAHPVKLAHGQALEFRSRPIVSDAPILHMHHPICYSPQPP